VTLGLAHASTSRFALSLSGTGFVALQSLQYSGYITVDHGAIKKSVEGVMDLNKDGNVDKKDMEQASTKVMEVLQFNMPAGGGFVAGFVGGVRSG
jgi:FUN14 domain-containing protein 1